jgi:hypothetical protein
LAKKFEASESLPIGERPILVVEVSYQIKQQKDTSFVLMTMQLRNNTKLEYVNLFRLQ